MLLALECSHLRSWHSPYCGACQGLSRLLPTLHPLASRLIDDYHSELIHALLQRGMFLLYGVPGNAVLGLFDQLDRSAIDVIFMAGIRLRLEGELWQALQAFLQELHGPTLVSVELDRHDASDALRNLTEALGRKVKSSSGA